MIARNNLFKWPKNNFFKNNDSESVARFLYDDIIYHYKIFRKLIYNGGPENRKWVKALTLLYNIQNVTIFVYNFPANKVVKKEYKFIIDSLAKLTMRGRDDWIKYLYTVL